MSKLCCMPGCNNRQPEHTVFHVPAKKFCSGARYLWANQLEKIVLGLRQDNYIKNLYKRDTVRMCEVHFTSSDIITKGTRKQLKVGVLPSLCMPRKSCFMDKSARPQPNDQELQEYVYYKNFAKLKAGYIPKEWIKLEFTDHVVFHLKDEHDQAKYTVVILSDFSVSASYYGWGASVNSYIRQIHSERQSITVLLMIIKSSPICCGSVANEATPHFATKACDPLSDSLLPTQTILAKRSKTCGIFVQNKQQCFGCQQLDKTFKNKRKKTINAL